MRIAMLGAGFIGRFYADALQGYRSKDKVVSIYARREESAPNLQQIMVVLIGLPIWKQLSPTPMWMWYVLPYPTIFMKLP